MIGVAPEELVGINMRALLALTSDTASLFCPFCRTMGDDDRRIRPSRIRSHLSGFHFAGARRFRARHADHPRAERYFDRREAERRYRELFDNIQEGLFFSTPDGRFVEVNDAMVRMLGYASREELLQVDIPTQLYFLAGSTRRHAEP